MRIVGIDPGESGAIVSFDGNDVEVFYLKNIDPRHLWGHMASLDPASCFLESVHAGPSMGSSAAFGFGKGFGFLYMAAIAAGLDVSLVSPQKWQKCIGLEEIGGGFGVNDKKKKKRNRDMAKTLFPKVLVTNANADALLIAHYGRMQ